MTPVLALHSTPSLRPSEVVCTCVPGATNRPRETTRDDQSEAGVQERRQTTIGWDDQSNAALAFQLVRKSHAEEMLPVRAWGQTRTSAPRPR